MRPLIGSEFCATPACFHHYNWHYRESTCAAPGCPCKLYTAPDPPQETPVPENTPLLRPEDLQEGALYEAANGSGETARIVQIDPEAAHDPHSSRYTVTYTEYTKTDIIEDRPEGRTRTLRASRFVTRYRPLTGPTPRSTRAHIASPPADHIAQILREDRLTQETPVPTTPQRAVIYVSHPQPDLDGDDLYRRTRLRLYAQECGYTVDAVITAHDPEDAEHPPVAFQLIRRALMDEDVDVIVLWHRDLNVPDTLVRDDLPVTASHTHVWVTALDGDDRPALGADGKTWEHCGICGLPRDLATPVIPQTLPPLTVGGNQPKYPAGTWVLYDDDEGVVRKHRYNGERGAWDALVDFEGGSGWCWESDLTPPHTEGE
jgi:hypothetical protein